MKNIAPRALRYAGAGAAAFALALAIPATAMADPASLNCDTATSNGKVVDFDATKSCSGGVGALSVVTATADNGSKVTFAGAGVSVSGLPEEGVTTITAKVKDSGDPVSEAQWTIVITTEKPEEPKPVLGADDFTVKAGESVKGNLLANDTLPKGWVVIVDDGKTAKGYATLAADGTFGYTANKGESGVDTFQYGVVNEETEEVVTGTIKVTITASGNGGGDNGNNNGGNNGNGTDKPSTGGVPQAKGKTPLPKTGSPVQTMAIAGAGALVLGAGAMVLTRRRKAEQV
ncbi:hypothetical protein Afil01_58810 [Actinorhabdospora filicis]|uniref:Gram-positive cocci surface proteins LPxTG domain-containing protein n=1 Tax=Actinorhabdospora filicis TaxID=1785913 RepID=A0A9W6SQG4_9ACTN|nr:Ig-like domain-containing protein [Actinorhabdospora filicis]GLZ81074.1 hypothetical protein Afil01_58810 [Actinorhabdospora filicis]